MNHRSTLLSWLLGIWLVGVAFLTLWPTGPTRAVSLETFLCVGCGWRGKADMVLNWLMFLPGGMVMGALLGARRALLMGASVTVLIEIAQVGLAARDPALQDLLANLFGAGCGIFLVRAGLTVPVRSGLVLLGTVSWLAPTLLLAPTTSGNGLLIEWTPVHHGGRYEGEVVQASLGGRPLPVGPVVEPATLDTLAASRSDVRVTLVVGPPPSRLRSIVRVTDEEAFDLVDLAILGNELSFAAYTVALRMGLDQPRMRWPQALDGRVPGDTIEVAVLRSQETACFAVDGRENCSVSPSLATGWGLLMNLDERGGVLRMLMSMSWPFALGTLCGLGIGGLRRAALWVTVLGIVGIAVGSASPEVNPELTSLVWLVAGGLVGAGGASAPWAGLRRPARSPHG